MRALKLVNAVLFSAVLVMGVLGCAKKTEDPLDDIKAMIPAFEQRLNRRDLAGLQSMGEPGFQSNALVIEVFSGRVADSVKLSLSRIQMDGPEATMILNMDSREWPTLKRELHLFLRGDGKWRINRYEIVESVSHYFQSDSTNPGDGQ